MKIVFDKDNDCVGCPQGCIHCGRGWYRFATGIICEKCNEEVEEVYDTADGYWCADCVLGEYSKTTIDDIDEKPEKFEDEEWIYFEKLKRSKENEIRGVN